MLRALLLLVIFFHRWLLKEAFPGAKVQESGNKLIFTMPNGQKVTFTFHESITVSDDELSRAKREHGIDQRVTVTVEGYAESVGKNLHGQGFLAMQVKPVSLLVWFYLCNFFPPCIWCFVYISCHRICITVMEARTRTFLTPTGIASSTGCLVQFHIVHLVHKFLIHFVFLLTIMGVVSVACCSL